MVAARLTYTSTFTLLSCRLLQLCSVAQAGGLLPLKRVVEQALNIQIKSDPLRPMGE